MEGHVTDNEYEVVEEESGSRQSAWLVIAGIIVIAVAIFIAQNAEDVPIEFLFFEGSVPLWLIIVTTLVLGAILGQVFFYLRRRKKRKDEEA